jgi:hypothetical protein
MVGIMVPSIMMAAVMARIRVSVVAIVAIVAVAVIGGVMPARAVIEGAEEVHDRDAQAEDGEGDVNRL